MQIKTSHLSLILIVFIGVLSSCKTPSNQSNLPSRIEIIGDDFPAQLDFTTNRNLVISVQDNYDKGFTPMGPPLNQYKLNLLICDGGAVGILVQNRLIWWGEYWDYTTQQMPKALRESVTSIVQISNRRFDAGKTLKPPIPPSHYSSIIDGQTVTNLEAVWKSYGKKDSRFIVTRFE